jgi:xanthine/CO dehydrogenase XdhC/CoxF family maturation factor
MTATGNTASELCYPLIELLLLIFLFCRLKIRVMKFMLKVSHLVLFLQQTTSRKKAVVREENNTQVNAPAAQINLGEEAATAKFVEQLFDDQNGVHVADGAGVQGTVVDAEPP